jgi:hypothetical protein
MLSYIASRGEGKSRVPGSLDLQIVGLGQLRQSEEEFTL